MFKLVDLPYAPDGLAPAISAETISFHHGKHLQTYVDNLNKLLPGSGFDDAGHSGLDPESLLKEIVAKAPAGPLFNNAGQVLNHEMYFLQFKPAGDAGSQPGMTKLHQQILSQWGTLDAFKEEFAAKGAGLFGSGWVWLAAEKDGHLVITQEPNAGNPAAKGLAPILTFDVWEHAYYLDYQNRRPAYMAALWDILDWTVLEARYAAR